MDVLAQELLDGVIDYLSPSEAKSCSLLATRWRKRCQQRYFLQITFSDEGEVIRWCADVPQDPDGIPSYVQDVEFRTIYRWLDPTVLGRALKCLHRVRTLAIKGSAEPAGGLYNSIASSGFGSEVTSFALSTPLFPAKTSVQLILSFPKLRELLITTQVGHSVPIPPYYGTWHRGPLKSLELTSIRSRDSEFLALCGITSRRIELDVGYGMEKVVACSSEVMEELLLRDPQPPASLCSLLPPASHLPPLTALTTVEVKINTGVLSARITEFLSCIFSAPALSSITFRSPFRIEVDVLNNPLWTDVDKWLARLTTRIQSGRNLRVILSPWSEGSTIWEECLTEFRKAGGELEVESDVCN